MTTYEIIATIALWVILGLFICHKAKWFKSEFGEEATCVFAILFAPLAFIWDVINRIFIQKWH